MTVMIETERLILRPPVMADFDGWAAFMGDAEAARFLGGAQSRALSWRGFMAMAGSWALNGYGMFSLVEKDSGAWLGRIGPWRPEGWPGNEVGWGLLPAAQGRGYGVEAATAAIDWAFETLGWADVIHCIDSDNHPSIALAKRLGSTNKGPGRMPEPYQDDPVDIWGQTREQWRARRG